MKKSLSAFIATALIFSLWSSTLAQTGPRRQKALRTGTSRETTDQPAIVIVSDHDLTDYATQRSGDEYTITIHQVGNFETASNGQAYRQKQPAGTNDLVIAFRLQEGTNPQLFGKGKELRIFFTSQGTPPVLVTTTAPQNSQPLPQKTTEQGVLGPGPGATTGGPDLSGTTAPGLLSNDPIEAIAPPKIEDLLKVDQAPNTCDNLTEPQPEDPKDGFIVIDANTGKILEGATHVHENTRVKVAFVNKNPFKYDYNFQLIPKDVGNATVISFLGLIPGFSNIPGILPGITPPSILASQIKPAPDAGKANPTIPGAQQIKADVSECKAFQKKLVAVASNGEKIATALKDAADLLKTTNDEYVAFLKATDTNKNGGTREKRISDYKESCVAASKALRELQKVFTLATKFDEFSKSLKLDLFSEQVTEVEKGVDSSGCDQVTQTSYKKTIGGLKMDVGAYKTRLDDLKKAVDDNQKKFEAPAKIIKAALGSSNSSTSFAEAAYAPSLGDATSVSITITRKNLRDENPKEEMVAVSPLIEIGEARVVLSGGVGFSTINERTIIRQQSLVPDSAGALTLGNRFGFENRSQFRPSGVILLNGLITRFPLFGKQKDATFALSAGLVLSDRNDGLATEFIAGPSIGLANNKMFLTLGFHAARVQQLSGGFQIGDPVPANLADPLPLQKNWQNGLIIALTFRFFQPK